MDALADLEELSEQSSCHSVGTRQRRTKCKFGHAVPANLSRAKVAREKKKVSAKGRREPRPPGTGKSPAPPAAPVGAKLGRAFVDYKTLIETCRDRAAELALSRAEIDRIGGFTAGHSSKLLCRGNGKDSRRLGTLSFQLMLNTLGLKMVLIEDEEATQRTLALRRPVYACAQRFGNTSKSGALLSADRSVTTKLPAPEKTTLAGLPGPSEGHSQQTRR